MKRYILCVLIVLAAAILLAENQPGKKSTATVFQYPALCNGDTIMMTFHQKHRRCDVPQNPFNP